MAAADHFLSVNVHGCLLTFSRWNLAPSYWGKQPERNGMPKYLRHLLQLISSYHSILPGGYQSSDRKAARISAVGDLSILLSKGEFQSVW